MDRFPTLFVSHGAPTFAMEPGKAGAQLGALGRSLAKPRTVVLVSPHWMTTGVAVTSAQELETIHDFGGFPRALYDIRYPAKGDPLFARSATDVLRAAGWDASLDASRGLDHGAWVPLLHMYPRADVPVIQVSMPLSLDPASAYRLGRALAPLAEEGALIVGSGSLTHNLYEFRHGAMSEASYAREFTQWIRQAVQAGDTTRLANALAVAPHAARAHPTSEHFLPLLVALGAAKEQLPATVLDGGIEHGVLAMESYLFGRAMLLDEQGADA